jgi:hypothetical protein
MSKFRTKFIDPDYRRDPKTERFCVRCQKDLKPGQPFRVIHLVDGGPFALHRDDEAAYQAQSAAAPGGQDAGELGCFPVGMDCARKIGLEFTLEPGELP